jgi:hypothetical protein
VTLIVLTLLMVVPSSEGFAQKKKSTKEETTNVQVSPRSGGGLREWLVQHQGLPSNKGTLQKVGPDYLLFDDDGTEIVVPIASIQSVSVKKEKEDEEKPEKVSLVFKLVSAD